MSRLSCSAWLYSPVLWISWGFFVLFSVYLGFFVGWFFPLWKKVLVGLWKNLCNLWKKGWAQWARSSAVERALQICLTTFFFKEFGLNHGHFANYCTIKNKNNKTPTSSTIWKRSLCRKTGFKGKPYFA